ncbi:MAG: DUF6807 family protein [Zavarzinella sp.]
MRRSATSLVLLAFCSTTWAETKVVTAELTAKKAVSNALVRISLTEEQATGMNSATAKIGGQSISCQLATASLNTGAGAEVVAIVPELSAEKPVSVEITLDSAKNTEGFTWKDAEGDAPVLFAKDKQVLAYVRPKFDPNPKALTNPTFKVYHHLYDESGTVRLTNGPEGRFPHHRGIYFGFNRISYNGKSADVWHCRNGESQQHDSTVATSGGPILGRQVVTINWNGQDGKTFAKETRQIDVIAAPGGRYIEFRSLLTTELDKVRLDGDPQHAGFHFRAAQDVEKNPKETYYLRPSGKGAKGTEINWTPKGKNSADVVNRAWTAMSFVVADKRFTCVYVDHSSNPKEARQSERSYGRFGTYFEYDLSKNNPLKLQYRLFVKEGEVTAEDCSQLSSAFDGGITVSVK